jgi:peptide/nickel transport system substrate-binding protein
VKLANGGLAMATPPGTPMRSSPDDPIPGTGPYMVATANRQGIRYVRNPLFHEWSHAAQPAAIPDEIVWRFGLSPAEEVRTIRRGHADWTVDPVPGSLLPVLARRYAGQLRSYPSPDTEFLSLNTGVPPFDDVRVRRALNLAIDRGRMVAVHGGHEAADPTCQLLPPGVPGYSRYCPYTRQPENGGDWTAPDLARARRLVAKSKTRGMLITVWGWTDDAFAPPIVSALTASALRAVGYRTRVHLVSHASLDDPPRRRFDPIAVIPVGWSDITADGYFAPWIVCSGANNHGFFCAPKIDRQARRARSLEAADPRAAAHLWASIDHEIVDKAALVPLVNLRQSDFVSERVSNLQHNPYLGLIVDQLSVRRD